MTPLNQSSIIKLGNCLFPFRRLFYLIPVVFLLMNRHRLYYPFGSYLADEGFEFISFFFILLGMGIRLYASGSSRRIFVRKNKQLHLRLERKGIFARVRNPHFIGDFFIVLGLSLLLLDPPLVALSLFLFVGISMPILLARENMLLSEFQNRYEDYRNSTPLFLPTFKTSQPKSRKHLRWLMALQKEGNVLGAMGILFFCMEQFREVNIQGSWNHNPLWFAVVVPFLFLCLFVRALDPYLKDLPETHGMLDD